MTPQDLWATVKSQLEMQMDRGSYETWIKHTHFLEYRAAEGHFVIGAPNAYVCEMLNTRLMPKVQRVMGDIADQKVTLYFQVAHEEAVLVPVDDMPLMRFAPPPSQEPHDAPSIAEIVRSPRLPDLPQNELNARYTFDRFVVNKSNEMVYQAACAVAEAPGTVYNPFLIYGGVGLGKTHILQAIGHECTNRGKKVLYVSSEVFVTELIQAIRSGTTAMFRQRYRTVDVLLVDDVQFFASKESTQEEFFHTYNALLNWNKQIVMVSDKHPRDLNGLDERLKSRFQGGLLADIQVPEFETRRSILQMWMQERGVELDTAVLDMMTQRAPSSVRELEGMFVQLLAQLKMSGGHISQQRAEHTLTRYVQPRNKMTVERIIEVTAMKTGVSATDILGKKRSEVINEARQIAMYLCREMTQLSLPQIGDTFGRNHTTIMHACQKITTDLLVDPSLKARIEKIRKAL